MKILALEPYAATSHLAFLDGLAEHSENDFTIWTLPARKWKWRMRTASIEFRRRLDDVADPFDLWLVSDYTNLTELRGLLPERHRRTPAILYFHENQLSYPLAEHDRVDHHFGLTHFHDALSADAVWFNSEFHRREFLRSLEDLLSLVPDIDTAPDLERIRARAEVHAIGTDRAAGSPSDRHSDRRTRVAWNHRWEYDKAPEVLARSVLELADERTDFELHLFGQRFRRVPPEFDALASGLGDRLVDHGFLDESEYEDRLAKCDIVLSTAIHEFFGIGSLEAVRLGLWPVWPNDLAYPELLPNDLREMFLYTRGASEPKCALASAIDAVRRGDQVLQRQELVEFTDAFSWESLAPRYDAAFRTVAAEPNR